MAGGGVFRFQDGSLLTVNLAEGSACIDLAAAQGHFTVTYRIIGGTGRFKDASGTLTLTYTVVPVVADASNDPQFLAATGELTGTVSRVAAKRNAKTRGTRKGICACFSLRGTQYMKWLPMPHLLTPELHCVWSSERFGCKTNSLNDRLNRNRFRALYPDTR